MTKVRVAVVATLAAVAVSLALLPAASASPGVPGPPFVNHVAWAKWGDLSSLRVFPTESGRSAAGQLGMNAQADQAWAEVLTLSPDADIPGMKSQFLCHWRFAEFAWPGKTSWNLEPWRPQVDDIQMLDAGCNPGGTEEPF